MQGMPSSNDALIISEKWNNSPATKVPFEYIFLFYLSYPYYDCFIFILGANDEIFKTLC